MPPPHRPQPHPSRRLVAAVQIVEVSGGHLAPRAILRCGLANPVRLAAHDETIRPHESGKSPERSFEPAPDPGCADAEGHIERPTLGERVRLASTVDQGQIDVWNTLGDAILRAGERVG